MSVFLSAPFELLCKISTYLTTPDLATFSVLCKICHQSSKSQHIIDLTALETSYSMMEIREMLSILKYHEFKTWILPTSLILSDTVINRLLESHFQPHFIIRAHKYLNDVYFTDIKNRCLNKHCFVDTLILCGNARLISSKNYEPPSNIMNCIVNLKLMHLNICTSRIIGLDQFIGCKQTLKTLIISSRNLLTKHNNSLQINCLLTFKNLQNLTIKNESLTECIEDNKLELPLKLFICLCPTETSTVEYNAHELYDDDFKYGIDYNPSSSCSLYSEIKHWSINIKHLTLTRQYIQLPLEILLSLFAKYQHLITLNIEYCVFINEYDRANKYDRNSVYYHQTWMQQYDTNDEFIDNPWKRHLNEQLLEYVNKLSLNHKFKSETLTTLCFKGTKITSNLLKVIAQRFGETLTKLSLITCEIPYIQYDWKYLSIQCIKLKTLHIIKPAFKISIRCIKNTDGYDLYRFGSPLQIIYVSNQHQKQNNFKYKNLYFILKDIFNGNSYYEAMHNQYNKKQNNNLNNKNILTKYKLSTNEQGDTIIIQQTEKHFNNNENKKQMFLKYRNYSVNVVVNYKQYIIHKNDLECHNNAENMKHKMECKYCGIDVIQMDMLDHVQTQCLQAIIKCNLCDVDIKRNNLIEHWLLNCIKYECICTICLQTFIGRQSLLHHYEQHNTIADKDQLLYQFNWHSRKMDNKLFTLYPMGTIWICNRCNHRSLNVKVKMAKMMPFKLHMKRIQISEICEQCKTPRFVDHVNFGWKLPSNGIQKNKYAL